MGNLGYPNNSWTFSRFNIFLWWQQNYILQSQNMNILLHPMPKFPLQNGNIATYSSIKGSETSSNHQLPPPRSGSGSKFFNLHFPTIWWGLFCPERMPNHHSQPHCVPPTARRTTRRLRLPPESWLKKLRKDLEKWRWVEFEPNPYGKKNIQSPPNSRFWPAKKDMWFNQPKRISPNALLNHPATLVIFNEPLATPVFFRQAHGPTKETHEFMARHLAIHWNPFPLQMDHGGHGAWWIFGGLANLRRAMKIWDQWPPQRLPAFWLNAPSLVWSVSPGRIPTAIFAAQTGWHVLDNRCVDHAAWRIVLLGYGSNSWPRKHPFLGLVAIKPYGRAPPAVSAMSLQCLCVKKTTGNPLRWLQESSKWK